LNLQADDGNMVSMRALLLSLIFHASIILLIISINNSSIQRDKLMVIDFTMEDSGNTLKDDSPGSEAGPRKMSENRGLDQGMKKGPSEIDQSRLQMKEPEPEMQILTASSIRYVAATETQAQSAAHEVEISGEKNEGITVQDSIDTSSKGQRGTLGGSFTEDGWTDAMGTGMKGLSGGGNGKAGYGQKIGYLRGNFTYIRDLIQKKVVYPAIARKMGWEGRVTVSFIIFSDGLTKDLRIMKSSSIEVLDKSAIEAVKDASPFPKPPSEAQIIIPIVYKLN